MLERLRRHVPSVLRRNYALKFGIVLLLIGASVGMIGFFATEEIRSHVQADTDEAYATLAEQEANSLQAWSESNEQRVQTLIRSPDLRSLSTTELRQYTQYPDRAHSLHIVDIDDGEVLSSTDQGVAGESIETLAVPDSDVLLEAIEPFSVYRSTPYTLESETPAVTYAQATGDGAIGVVYTVELDQYAEQFTTYGEDRSTTLVVDDEDRLVFGDAGYGDDLESFLEEYGDADGVSNRESAGAATRSPDDESGLLLSYGFPSEEYVVGYAPIEGTDWTVLVHEPTADAYGFVRTVQWLGFAATAGLVVFVTALGAVIGRNTARSINRLRDRAARMERGDLAVDLETDRVDEIGQLYTAFDSMRRSLRNRIEEVDEARADAERERRHTAAMNRDLTRAADQYAAVMQAAADGDLTVRMDPEVTETEPMGQIATEFNGMVAQLEETIAKLGYFAEQVATASERVSASSESVREASENVADSVQTISDGAARQNESLQEATQELSALSRRTQAITDSSNAVARLAERTAETGNVGQEAAQDAISGMDSIEAESGRAVDEIERLEREVAEIDRLIERIQVIADRTNMLALSTNLEARTSGTDGEEFAAVAEEVRELSGNTKATAAEVESHLERIREQTQASASAVERTSDVIETASGQVERAVEALEAIAEYAGETNAGVQEISAATDDQMDSTYEVVTEVSEVASISQETAIGADTVAAATDEQTNALNEVTGAMAALAERARGLSSALGQFETDQPAEGKPPLEDQ